MKLFYTLIILFLLSNCSFDDKTGIWKNVNSNQTIKDSPYKDFKTIYDSEEAFDETINLDKELTLSISAVSDNDDWLDPFYSSSNNLKNFKYNNNNQLIFSSKKLTKYNPREILLFDDNNIILNDQKGNIIIYSIKEKKILKKNNFYKNRYKKLKKDLNFVINNNILYVSDNLGYVYAYNYQSNSLKWAKNFKVPFKSNFKIYKNMIVTSNHKNNIFFLNKDDGEVIKSIPTEETNVSNQFKNNFSIQNNNLFFLNSFGSLYSIDINTKKINWFINLNQSLELTTNNLFNGSQIVYYKNRIAISSDKFSYLINSETGNILSSKNYISNLRPIMNNQYIFLITRNNYLISSKLSDGKILYSQNIENQISKLLNMKKKVEINNFFLINDKIFIFLNNRYIALFNIYGQIEKINKLPSKIKTSPIFINGKILYLNKKNSLNIID